MKLCVLESRSRWGRRGGGIKEWERMLSAGQGLGVCRDERRRMLPALGTEKRETALPVPSSPGQEICVQGAKEKCPGRQQRLRGLGGGGARLQPAPKGSPGDSRLEARRRDSDRGSREEEPETFPFSDIKATSHQADPLSSLGLKKRVSQGPGISGNGPEGATSLHPGGEEAGRSGSAGAGLRGGGGRQGTAEPSPERDANRQTWEKVNKGHAPCRRPAGAHPPLRPPPVHFHSQRFSPAGLPRSPGGGAAPDPQPAPPALGLRTLHTHLERVSPAPPKNCA
ncbi:uncharacterized protein [Physeter macrocephalus]|uniref:Uncharacterized protein isoform X2 n=1 Tax=Physeter macrocephalus TaxID=9755 RepID=A0A455BZ47_PHYMC|nr:uncharacterized protein LOC114486765 isoform X2 [Physeter catodon]|eukprot:XP_028349051.1 uncharacterized protein LOC114486765 isoform X2 [Physeter catodon]